MPGHDIGEFFRVPVGAIEPQGVAPEIVEIARWAKQAEVFTLAELQQKFPEYSTDALMSVVDALQESGFFERPESDII